MKTIFNRAQLIARVTINNSKEKINKKNPPKTNNIHEETFEIQMSFSVK